MVRGSGTGVGRSGSHPHGPGAGGRSKHPAWRRGRPQAGPRPPPLWFQPVYACQLQSSHVELLQDSIQFSVKGVGSQTGPRQTLQALGGPGPGLSTAVPLKPRLAPQGLSRGVSTKAVRACLASLPSSCWDSPAPTVTETPADTAAPAPRQPGRSRWLTTEHARNRGTNVIQVNRTHLLLPSTQSRGTKGKTPVTR